MVIDIVQEYTERITLLYLLDFGWILYNVKILLWYETTELFLLW